MTAGIIPLKSPKDYFYAINTSFNNKLVSKSSLFDEVFGHFEKELILQIKNLFDEKLPFFADELE